MYVLWALTEFFGRFASIHSTRAVLLVPHLSEMKLDRCIENSQDKLPTGKMVVWIPIILNVF